MPISEQIITESKYALLLRAESHIHLQYSLKNLELKTVYMKKKQKRKGRKETHKRSPLIMKLIYWYIAAALCLCLVC